MIDNNVYGSSEERILKERFLRERFLDEQGKVLEKKTKIINKLKTTFKKYKDVFSLNKGDITKTTGNRENIKNSKNELNESEKSMEQEKLKEKEALELRANAQKNDFVKFVNSKLEESNSGDIFEKTKDRQDRTIYNVFSGNLALQKVIISPEMEKFEGLINLGKDDKGEKGDKGEKYYFNFTYSHKKESLKNSMRNEYLDFPAKDVFLGFIINKDDKVKFVRKEEKVGEDSLMAILYYRVERVLNEIFKIQTETKETSIEQTL